MFRGIGAAEKNVLAYLGLADHATVADISRVFQMEPKTARRAMRSLAAKGGARLTTAPPMTVYPIRQHSRPSSAARVPSGAAGSELALAQTPRPAPMPARQTGVPSNNLRAAKPGQAKVLREPVSRRVRHLSRSVARY